MLHYLTCQSLFRDNSSMVEKKLLFYELHSIYYMEEE